MTAIEGAVGNPNEKSGTKPAVDVALFDVSGAQTPWTGVPIEPAIELGAGWRRAVRSWAAGAELGAQLHGFAPESLRRAGGSAGGVKRGFLLLTLSRRLAR